MNTARHPAADDCRLRLARLEDVPAIEALIPISARQLQGAYYGREQIEAALGPVFAVDRQLIDDGTYFVVEAQRTLVGCGGWSRRQALFGGDQGRGTEPALDPARDAARVRAFFVHPQWARRGIGRSLITACEQAIARDGFRNVELVATLAGEPLYLAFGYAVIERFAIALAGGLALPVVKMAKTLPAAEES